MVEEAEGMGWGQCDGLSNTGRIKVQKREQGRGESGDPDQRKTVRLAGEKLITTALSASSSASVQVQNGTGHSSSRAISQLS